MRTSGRIHSVSALGDSLAANVGFLQANSEAYEGLVKKIQRMDLRKEAEAVLDEVVLAAHFAGQFHPGRFVDGAIENLALEIGAGLGGLTAEESGFALPFTRKESRRRVLHVATSVLEIGGHTRMLHNWVRSDKSSCHWLALINQGDVPIPLWLSEALRSTGGDLVVFPKESRLCQKAKWLRETARRIADLVVLHHYGCDVVPTVAFAADRCPPVALLNHADHEFWLGGSVSDIVINLRTAGSEHTLKRRFLPSNAVIPIPLPEDPLKGVSRTNARQALGIPEDQIVLLSVSRALKFRPCGPYDFVATAGKILDRQSGADLYLVGESPSGIAPYLRCGLHKRLHFVGRMEDPSLYRAAADVYLESFPFGSQTALLEAALSGLPAVPAYAPLFPLLVANDDAVLDLIPNPQNEHEYIQRVELLIQYPKQRKELGERLRKRLLVDHVGEGWLDRLLSLYGQTDSLEHRPKPLPVSSCSIENADIGLSLWHAMANGKNYPMNASTDIAPAVLYHTALLAKEVSDYARARRFAWRSVWHDPYRWASWRLLLITLLGRPGRLVRQALRLARVL